MADDKRIREFAETLAYFFLNFDATFMIEEDVEELLTTAKESLENKIRRNEGAMAVIMACGGSYDRRVDAAKVLEFDALLKLLYARKELKEATEEATERRNTNTEALKLFGL